MEISARRVLVPLLMLLVCGAAEAARPGRPPRHVAMLAGVERDGALDPQLDKILRRRIERTGEVVRTPRPPLSLEERGCSSVDCLGPLLARRRGKLIWGAAVQGAAGAEATVRTWLYEGATRRLFESERPCSACDEQALASVILATRLALLDRLGRDGDEPQPPAPPAPPPAPPPVAAAPPPPPPKPPFFATPRGRAVTVMLPLLAVTLGTSIVLSALRGAGQDLCLVSWRDDGGAQTRCNGDLLLGLGYGASAALAGGIALTFLLPGGK